jgi:hypothetical protein
MWANAECEGGRARSGAAAAAAAGVIGTKCWDSGGEDDDGGEDVRTVRGGSGDGAQLEHNMCDLVYRD